MRVKSNVSFLNKDKGLAHFFVKFHKFFILLKQGTTNGYESKHLRTFINSCREISLYIFSNNDCRPTRRSKKLVLHLALEA